MIAQALFGLLQPLREVPRRVQFDPQRQDFFEYAQGVFKVLVVAAAIVQLATHKTALTAQAPQQHPPQALQHEVQRLAEKVPQGPGAVQA